MFQWYSRAKVCYAYLSDVPLPPMLEDGALELSAFRQSVWFSRGWTLQEFLAPASVFFMSQDWQVIGEKFDDDLRHALVDVTGIDNFRRYEKACIAQKCHGSHADTPLESRTWLTACWASLGCIWHHCMGKARMPFNVYKSSYFRFLMMSPSLHGSQVLTRRQRSQNVECLPIHLMNSAMPVMLFAFTEAQCPRIIR